MKRADLTVGAEYLSSRSNDWTANPYMGQRVRILTLDPYAEPRRAGFGFRHDRRTISINGVDYTTSAYQPSDGKGPGVLVCGLDRVTGEPDRREGVNAAFVVSAASIRATWEDGCASIAARRARDHTLREAESARRETERVRVANLHDRASTILGRRLAVIGQSTNGFFTVSLDDFADILAIAERVDR